MMHVLCEEYETVYAACLLITSAVLGVDFGYRPTDQGALEYIVQIEPESLQHMKSAGQAISVRIPPKLQRLQLIRVQLGQGQLPQTMPASFEEPAATASHSPPGKLPVVPGVGFGYQPTKDGELEYIIQLEPQSVQQMEQNGKAILAHLPSGLQRVQVLRVQLGQGELPQLMPTAHSESSPSPQSPTNERPAELTPTDVPSLASPPGDVSQPLGDELAQYIPKSTRSFVSGQEAPSRYGTGNTTPSGSNTNAAARGPIPGAEERYGGSSSSGTNSGSVYGGGQTGGGGAAPSVGNSAASGNTAGTSSAANTSASVTAQGDSNANSNNGTGNRYSIGGNPPTAAGTNTGTAPAAGSSPAPSGNTTPSTGTSSADFYRFNQNGSTANNAQTSSGQSGSGNQAAPDLIRPSQPQDDWTSRGTPQDGTGQNNAGGNTNNNNQGTDSGRSTPQFDSTHFPYGSNSSQQHDTGQNPSWLNNSQNHGSVNPGNYGTGPMSPTPNQQVPNQPMPPQQGGYTPMPNGGYGNNYNNQPPPTGNYAGNGYGYQQSYPAGPNGYSPPGPAYNVASLPQNQGQQPPIQPPSYQTSTGNATAGSDNPPSDRETKPQQEDPQRAELPDWWVLLAVLFLISVAGNGYMWMITYEYQRKYRDLLEDVRDLRTLSDN